MPATKQHIEKVLAYLVDKGEAETLKFFNITDETLKRYKRRLRGMGGQLPQSLKKIPKVLIFDIETSTMLCHVWHLGKQRLGHEQIVHDWFMISYAAKWLFEPEMMSSVLTPDEAMRRDDKRIVTELWKLIDQADVIIGHNIKGFDTPKHNLRSLMHGLPPPSPYQMIDTLEVARKTFKFSSNRLDYIGQLIRNEGKIKTDYGLWLKCEAGDAKSLNEMLVYNEEDVRLTEDAYQFLRPWVRSHPNMAIYAEATEPSCPNCASTNIQENGHYYTSVNRFLSFRCLDCGAICRSRSTDVSLKQKRGILSPTAR